MSSLPDTQRLITQVKDMPSAKLAWESWVSWDTRAVSCTATCAAPVLKRMSQQILDSSNYLRAAAEAYYGGGNTEIADALNEVTEVTRDAEVLRARLQSLYAYLPEYSAPSITPAAVESSHIPVPIPAGSYLFETPAQVVEVTSPQQARLTFTSTTGYVEGTVLVVGGDGVTRAYPFNTDQVEEFVGLEWSADGMSLQTTSIQGLCIVPKRTANAQRRGALGAKAAVVTGFITASQLQSVIGGEITQTSEFRDLNVDGGVVEGVPHGSIVVIGSDQYVCSQGQLFALYAAVPPLLLSGDQRVRVVTQTLTRIGLVVAPAEVGVTYTLGDVTVQGTPGDEVDGMPSTQKSLKDVLAQWSDAPSSPSLTSHVQTPTQASQLYEYADELSAYSSALLSYSQRLTAPIGQRNILFALLSQLDRVGLDRAADTLRETRVADFLALQDAEASYSDEIKTLTGSLIVRVQG